MIILLLLSLHLFQFLWYNLNFFLILPNPNIYDVQYYINLAPNQLPLVTFFYYFPKFVQLYGDFELCLSVPEADFVKGNKGKLFDFVGSREIVNGW